MCSVLPCMYARTDFRHKLETHKRQQKNLLPTAGSDLLLKKKKEKENINIILARMKKTR